MIRLLILAAALYAALALVNCLAPGPGEADIRGPARTVQP